MNAKAKIGSEAIESVHGSKFTYGSSARLLYIASGGSEDWAYVNFFGHFFFIFKDRKILKLKIFKILIWKGDAGIPYSYCLELRPGGNDSDSHYGFALPEDRAIKAGEETFVGVREFLKSIKKNWVSF